MTDTANLILAVDTSQIDKGVKSLDDLAKAGARTEEVTKKLAASTGVQAQSISAASDEVQKLLNKYDPLGAKLRTLEADFNSLSEAAKKGLNGPGADRAVDQAYATLNSEIAKTKGLMEAAGLAGVGAFGSTAIAAEKSMLSTVGAKRELMVLGHEAMTGNFSKMPGSFLVLAERMHITEGLFSVLTVSIGTAAIAGVALAVAFAKGAAEIKNFENSVTLTNSAIGLSATGFRNMQLAMTEIGTTQGKAATVLTEIAASGRLAGSEIQNIAEVAVLMEKATGVATEKTIAQFVKLADEPVKASLELNKTFNYLTASVYEQIKALEDQGKRLEAGELAERTYAEAMKARASAVVENTGSIERAWRGVGNAAKSAWDWMLGLGRDTSPADKLAKSLAEVARIQNQIDAVGKFGETGGGAATGGTRGGSSMQTLQARLADARALVDAQQAGLEAEQKTTEAATKANEVRQKGLDATITWDKLREQMMTREQRMTKEIEIAQRSGIDAGKSQVDIENMILTIREKYATKAPSTAAFDNAVKSAQEYIQALKDTAFAVGMTAEQSQLLAVARRAEKAPTQELTDEIIRQGEMTAIAVSSGNIQKLIDAERLKTAELGKSKTAIAELENATRLKTAAELDGLAVKAEEITGSQEIADAYRKEAAMMRELVAAASDNGAAADRLKQAQTFVKEVDTISKQVGQSLSDALMNGGTTAKDFLIKMFKTLVLRPILQPIITGVVGSVLGGSGLAAAEGVTGAGGSAGGSTMGSLSLLDMGSKLSSAYDLVTGGFAKLGATVSNYVSSIGFDMASAGTSSAAIAADTAAAAEVAASAGTTATAAGAMAATAATVLAGVGAGIGLGTLISGDKSLVGGSGMITTGVGTAIGAGIGTMILPGVGTAIGAALGGIVGGLANAAFGSGSKTVDDTGISGMLGAGGSTVSNYSDWSKSKGWFGGGGNGTETSAADAQVQKYIGDSVAKTTIAVKQYADILGLPADKIKDFTYDMKLSLNGLSAADAQKAIDTMLAGYGDKMASIVTAEIGPFVKQGETAGQTLSRLATSLATVNGVFGTLNLKLMDTSLYGADAASTLVSMFGSMTAFTQSTDYYYQNFYTQQERANKTTQQLTGVFGQLGLTMPATNAAFRALVESAQAAGNAGLLGTLLQLAPTFNDLQTSLTQLTATAMASVDSAYSALQASVAAEQTAALDNIAKQKTIATAAQQVATQNIASLQSIFDYLGGQVSSLMQAANPALSASQGSAFVTNALANAQSTGYLPDQKDLTAAVSAASAGQIAANYSTAYDQKIAQYKLAAELQALQGIAGNQKTVAEQQLTVAQDTLANLDAQATQTTAFYTATLAAADAQINGLKGIGIGVMSLADALAAFGVSVNRAGNGGGSNLTTQVSDLYQSLLGRAPDSGGLQNWLSSGLSIDQIKAGIMGSQEYSGLPHFAAGGSYGGGMAIVGENGPELINFNQRGTVYTATQTQDILNSKDATANEVRALRAENHAQAAAMLSMVLRNVRIMERWDGDGLPSTRTTV
jgi:hypothetical protein